MKTTKELKKFIEGGGEESPNAESISYYNSVVKRFIRFNVSDKTNQPNELVSSGELLENFSLLDIVNNEQVENPNILTDSGKYLNKTDNLLDNLIDKDDNFFQLDDDKTNLVKDTKIKKRKTIVRKKSTNTRYKK